MPTPHNNAPMDAFAKVVLMPGDPLRAKWIAETFLHDAVLVNTVRGINGYTGFTKNGKRISVMASGMGQPSIAIYSHELYEHYNVDAIIRIGTAGSYVKEAKLGSLILGQVASTESNYPGQFHLNGGTLSMGADFELLFAAAEAAKAKGLPFLCGNILSADHFYNPDGEVWKNWANLGGRDSLWSMFIGEYDGMYEGAYGFLEGYALYVNAALARKKALCLLTISDSFVEKGELTPEQRQEGLRDMIEVAIDAAEPFC